QIGSGSGAMTFQNGSTATESLGLAGSAAVITVDGTIQAVVVNAQITQASGVNVSAPRNDNLDGVAADGSGSFIGNATEVAGSVSVVQLDGSTLAQVDNSIANLSGGSSVTASESTIAVGVAGSVALGGKRGFGLGAAATEITDSTSALVTDSTISQT